MINALVTTLVDWFKLLMLTIIAGSLPVFGYYLGQYNAHQEFEKRKDLSAASLNSISKEEETKQISSSDDDAGSSPRSSSEPRRLTSTLTDATQTKSLPRERQRDLDFYKAILGKRVPSLAVARIVKKTGLSNEVAFLGHLHKLRYDFAATSRLILKTFFSDESKKRLSKQCEILERVDSEQTLDKSLGTTIKTFSPSSIFDSVEETTLLQIGDAIFPNYREIIDGLHLSLEAAQSNYPVEQLRKQVYKEIWNTDPEIMASFHAHPPSPLKWVRRESLGFLPKRGKKESSMKSATFSIELITVNDDSAYEPFQQPAKWVLISQQNTRSDCPDIKMLKCPFGKSLKPSKLKMDPIDLSEATVFKDDLNPSMFEIKGNSVLNRKKNISLILVAKDEESCDKWIESLSKFKRSRENASDNVAICLNFFLTFQENLYTRNYAALDMACEKIALHILDNGIATVRPAVPMAIRSALFKAAEEENWDDDAFKTTTAWMKLMIEATMEDLREFDRYSEGGSFNRQVTAKKKGGCSIM